MITIDSDSVKSLATSMFSILSFSSFYEDYKKRNRVFDNYQDGLYLDLENQQKDIERISEDMEKAHKEIKNVIARGIEEENSK